jgi:UDP-N-acetylglucosamine--N-acetylmuramyl-(pentapeptide) pyrophosphoryl-undecaprenol N-acetylglucosamine transferase
MSARRWSFVARRRHRRARLPGAGGGPESARARLRLHWVGTRRGLEARVVPAADIPLHCLPMRGLRGKGPCSSCSRCAAGPVLAAVPVAAAAPPAGAGGGHGRLCLRARRRSPPGCCAAPAAAGAERRGRQRQPRPGALCRCYCHRAFPACFAGIRHGALPRQSGARRSAGGRPASGPGSGTASVRCRCWCSAAASAPGPSMRPCRRCRRPRRRAALAHQCGRRTWMRPAAYAAQRLAGVGAVSSPLSRTWPEAYAWADLVICRAGALTVAELAVTGRPSILVPLPHAIDDHQTANARFLADAGRPRLLPQARLDPATWRRAAGSLDDRRCAGGDGTRRRWPGAARATQDIADCCRGAAVMSAPGTRRAPPRCAGCATSTWSASAAAA